MRPTHVNEVLQALAPMLQANARVLEDHGVTEEIIRKRYPRGSTTRIEGTSSMKTRQLSGAEGDGADWGTLSSLEKLGQVLTWPVADLLKEPAVSVLAQFYPDKHVWGQIAFTLKERDRFIPLKTLEDAVKYCRKALRAPTALKGGDRTPREGWEALLLLNRDGTPKQEVGTISLLLGHASPWSADYWFDSVRGVAMLGGQALDDAIIFEVARWLGSQARMAVTNLKLVGHCCVEACKKRPRDLLQEWFAGLSPWDEVPRLETWLTDIAGSPATAAVRDVSRLLLVSMVARAFNPGCQYRYVVLLEGEEDTGKSSLVRALAGPEWLFECSHALEGKEAYILMQGILGCRTARVIIYEPHRREPF